MRTVLALIFCASLVSAQTARHVVPSGGVTEGEALTEGTGWTLDYSGDSTNAIAGGDTIYLHGGTYTLTGTWVIYNDGYVGSTGDPIIYRNYPGDTVKIVRGAAGVNLISVVGDSVWLWGLWIERTAADTNNVANVTPSAPGFKSINCIYKNSGGNALSMFQAATGAEAYGNIFLFCGTFYKPSDGGKRAYPIYAQNAMANGWKYITDNIMAWPWTYGIHLYGSSAPLERFEVRGNTIFQAGWLDYDGATSIYSASTLLGIEADNPNGAADSITFAHEHYWTNATNGYGGLFMDYNVGPPTNVKADSNISVAGSYSLWGFASTTYRSLIGNVFAPGWLPADVDEAYTTNQWLTNRANVPDTVIVRMNAYESKRAHVVAYNLTGGDSISVNPTGFVSGDTLTFKSVQNLEGDTPFTVVYAGTAFNVPMAASRWTIETPITSAAPESHPTGALPETFPNFGVFLITGVAASEAPPAATSGKFAPFRKR